MNAICRAYEAQIDSVLEGERAVVARINTGSVDRYRTIIDPMGGDVRGYNKNPVVLWEHGKDAQRGTVPIGRGWVKARSSERDMIGKTIFAKDDFSQMLFEMYRDETLRGWSVNILPSEASPPTKEEMRSRPDLEACGMVYRKWELAEYSGTAVPGNAEALSLMVSRGYAISDEARAILGTVPPPVPAPAPAISEPVARDAPWIDHAGGVFVVRSADGATILSTADEVVAKQCLGVLGNTRSFEAAHHAITQEIRTSFHEFKTDIAALRDLMIHGRV